MSLSSALQEADKSPAEGLIRQVRAGELEAWDAHKILTWAVENFHPRLALSASFQASRLLTL